MRTNVVDSRNAWNGIVPVQPNKAPNDFAEIPASTRDESEADHNNEGNSCHDETVIQEQNVADRRTQKCGSCWKRVLSSTLVCMVIAACMYSNTFEAGFAWDDRAAVKANKDLQGSTPMWDLFYHDFWGQNITLASSHKSYRPITVLSYRFDYMLEGATPGRYHRTNVVLHSINTGLVHALSVTLELSSFQSFVVGILFAIHPIHSEAVAGIVGRADLLSCTFYIMALVCFLKASKSRKRVLRIVHYLLGFALLVLSALSKEVGFTALAAAVLCEILFASEARYSPDESPSAIEESSKSTTSVLDDSKSKTAYGWKQSIQWVLKPLIFTWIWFRLLATLCFGAIFMYFRIQVHKGAPLYQWTIMENQFALMNRGFTRSATIAYSHVLYCWLLLWPKDLAFDHGYAWMRPLTTVWDVRFWETVLLYVILAAIILTLLYYRSAIGLWCAGIAISSFLPASNVIVFVGTEVAERLLYLPTVGIFVGLGKLIPKNLSLFRVHVAVEKENNNSVKVTPRYDTISFLLVILLCLLAGALRTWKRNEDWLTELRLFESGVEVHPDNVKALNNLANLYMNKHGESYNMKAQQLLDKAIELYPDHSPAYYNLGLTYKQRKGGYAKAVENFYRAIFGGFTTPCGNYEELGMITLDIHFSGTVTGKRMPHWYVRAGGVLHDAWVAQTRHEFLNTSTLALDLTKVFLEEASRRGCESSDLWYARGLAALGFGFPKSALPELKKALLLEGGNTDGTVSSVTLSKIYDAMAQAGLEAGLLREIPPWYRAAIAANPSVGIFHSHYAQYWEAVGDITAAEKQHLEAIEVESSDFQVWHYFAKFLANTKRFNESMEAIKRALQFVPNNRILLQDLAYVEELLGKGALH